MIHYLVHIMVLSTPTTLSKIDIGYITCLKNYKDIYVMCATREDDILPRWRNASEDVNSYRQNGAHGHQPKGGQSCADGV